MKRRLIRAMAVLAAVAMLVSSSSSPVRAQTYDYLVYDDSNWYEAYLQLFQMFEQFRFWLHQAQRLPIDMASRYHGHSIDFTFHDLESGLLYAQRLLTALNAGDPTGAAYKQAVDPLDVPTDILGRMPADLQDRLTRAYGALEFADSVAALAVNETGAMRVEGPHNQQVAKAMEQDAASTNDDFQTQIAVLNKINAASTLGLRMQDQTNQFLMSSLEQSLVANQRQRDAEAKLINATIYQWRYGQAYGQDLFRNTASNLDTWRLR